MPGDDNKDATAPVGEKPQEAGKKSVQEIMSGTTSGAPDNVAADNKAAARRGSANAPCPKSSQLPMFLSKTYHMIDRCDSEIATWTENGDAFVIKQTDVFAEKVLPCYFKHSNFSSFARQLNFYSFRKLKNQPILTADFDARTACYVRFFHPFFQKDKPELLSQIKRATKSDVQSKDEMDDLRSELGKLKERMAAIQTEADDRMTEMQYEYNRRISALAAEHDKLAILVQQLLAASASGVVDGVAAAQNATANMPDMMRSLSAVAAMANSLRPPPPAFNSAAAATAAAAPVATAGQKRASPEGGATDDSNTAKKAAKTGK